MDLYLLSIIIIISIILYIIWKIFRVTEIHYNYENNSINATVRSEECPEFYPNSWLPVYESRNLVKGDFKSVTRFGNEMILFRGQSGIVYVFDAYCPHLGAHLGVGGLLVGDEIKCPFHGWQFATGGNCVSVPGLDKSNVPNASLKKWKSYEVNGFIYVWHHKEGKGPDWFPDQVIDVEDSSFILSGKTVNKMVCHLQEITENGSDEMHLSEVHGPVIYDNPLKFIINNIMKVEWTADWLPIKPPYHQKISVLTEKIFLFGYHVGTAVQTQKQIGTSIIYQDATSNFKLLGNMRMKIVYGIITIGPMEHSTIIHFYNEPTFKNRILAKLMIYISQGQIERDVRIWNTKRYFRNPVLAKNEPSLKVFRRWYKQFYSNVEYNE